MPDNNINDISSKITEAWSNSSKSKKIMAISVAGIIAVGIGYSTYSMTRPQMETLYSGLSLKEVAEVADVLSNQSIAYNIINGGQGIEVEEGVYNQAKILLASENVPQGKYSFEDALANDMSTTESEKQTKLHRLKEADLETLLEGIEGVKAADVTLVIPEKKNSFVVEKQQSSASVLLTLNKDLTTKQIEGIARLITKSVENLSVEDVHIVNDKGETLFSGEISDDDSSVGLDEQMSVRAKAEKEVKTKITDLLSASYDDIRVSSNLILDFDQYAEAREEYTPIFQDDPRGMIQNEKVHISSETANETAASGTPGEASNGGDTTYQMGNGSSTGTSSEVNEKDVTYLNNKIVSNLTKSKGSIDFDKSSVAVQVYTNKIYREVEFESADKTWEQFKEDNKTQVPIALDEEMMELIKQATGIKNVVVQGFVKPVFVDLQTAESEQKGFLPMAIAGVVGAIIAFILLKTRKSKKDEPIYRTELEIEVPEATEREDKSLEEIEFKEGLETKQRIEKFADENPAIVANLLRNWLTDDDWEDNY